MTSGEDGVVRVWDPASGALVTERRVARGHIGGLGYTADGRGLMVAERRGVVSTIDAETLERSGPRIDVGGRPVQAFTSPVESTAMVFTFDGEVVLVDLVAGRIVARRTLDHGANLGTFSPDGRFFADPSLDGRVLLLDGATATTVSDRAAHCRPGDARRVLARRDDVRQLRLRRAGQPVGRHDWSGARVGAAGGTRRSGLGRVRTRR